MSQNMKTSFLMIGMAGTGKSTFSQRLNIWLSSIRELQIDKETSLNSNITLINLDPAIIKTKLPLDVDIREIIDYENVMRTYKIGPNGAVTTTLNLFLMQWNPEINGEFAIIDTPGQIEAFVWSNSGKVLIEKLLHDSSSTNNDERCQHSNNVVLLYLLDSAECKKPSVFMCNMIYALIIKMRFNIPILLVFNKIDLSPVPIEWLQDYEKFMNDLDDESMSNSLLKSMALHFEEYYKEFDYVGVSSTTGEGKEVFFECIEKKLDSKVSFKKK